MSFPFTEKADEHSNQPHYAFTLTYSRLSGGSVVKIVVHVGKNRGDVGKNVRHVGKIVIDVGIPPYPLNKCVISLHRKDDEHGDEPHPKCFKPVKIFNGPTR